MQKQRACGGVLRITREHESFEIDDDYVTELFENAAQLGPNWKEALSAVSNELGLLDVGGKAKNSWARRAIQMGKSDTGLVHCKTEITAP